MKDLKKVVVVGWEKWQRLKECEKTVGHVVTKDSGVQTDSEADVPLPPAKFMHAYFGPNDQDDDDESVLTQVKSASGGDDVAGALHQGLSNSCFNSVTSGGIEKRCEKQTGLQWLVLK